MTVVILSRLSVILADAIVMLFVAISVYKNRELFKFMSNDSPSFHVLLFRDGTWTIP